MWRVWRLVRTAGQSHEQLPQRLHEHSPLADYKVCHRTGGTFFLMQTKRFVTVPVYQYSSVGTYSASSFAAPEQDPDLKGYETSSKIAGPIVKTGSYTRFMC